MTATYPTCIIVGAGPVGLYSAMVLAAIGCRVQVVSDTDRGTGWASGGMLGAVYETFGSVDHNPFLATYARSSQWLWSQLLSSIGFEAVEGSVFIARNDQERNHIEGLRQSAQTFDLDVARCDVPTGLIGEGAWACAQDIAINPRAMLVTLKQECVAAGVTFIQGRVTQVLPGRVLLLAGETLVADKIVIATGAGARELANDVPELSQIKPVKGQMLAIAGIELPVQRVIRAGRIYLIPRGQHIVVGATSDPDSDDVHTFDLDRHHGLLQEAIGLFPDLRHGQIVESWAGLRPMTPDGLPLLGHSHLQSVILATGTYRNGWLLAAGLANSVMGLVLEDQATRENLQPFSPLRFPN